MLKLESNSVAYYEQVKDQNSSLVCNGKAHNKDEHIFPMDIKNALAYYAKALPQIKLAFSTYHVKSFEPIL